MNGKIGLIFVWLKNCDLEVGIQGNLTYSNQI